MKILIINSGDKNSFAAVYDGAANSGAANSGADFDVVYSAEFIESNNTLKKPDKLINCLDKLSRTGKLEDIDSVAVNIGPGSFTGIRVGLALAKGIAMGKNLKLIPVNNFEILLNRAQNLLEGKNCCILIEQRDPEYYYAVYENNIIEHQGTDLLENILKMLKNDTVIVGDFDNETQIKHSYFSVINLKNTLNEQEAFQKAADLKYRENAFEDAQTVQPLYLKEFNFRKP